MLSKFPGVRTVHDLWYGSDLVHNHGRRERRALMLGSFAMASIGAAWCVFFALHGNWPIVGLDLVLILGGLCAGLLIARKQVQWAAVVLFTTLFVVICVIAWVFDASTPQAPRTTHLYLLPLGAAALLAFRDASGWLRHCVAMSCLAAFAFLSVAYGSPFPQYALPEHMRAIGAWIQSIAAISLLYSMLYVMQNDAVARTILEDELAHALEHEQLQLYYQPQLDVHGRVVGAEALIRWLHPERGLVMPGAFIEVAEQTGMILPIGQWVTLQACEQLRAWAGQPGFEHLRLAVNISQLQFRQRDFVAHILGAIDHYRIDASRLELELTESMLVQNVPDIIEKMTAIRQRGVTFSLDDFGTGYSALAHLKNLPLSQLKIDQSFVHEVPHNANDASIVRTVISLGHNLGLCVIAEGVETQEQFEFLAANECEYFQGYLYSRALPIGDFNAYVQSRPHPA